MTSLLKNQPLLYEPPPPPADLRRRMDAAYPEAADNAKLAVNVQNLQNAWEASQRVTRCVCVRGLLCVEVLCVCLAVCVCVHALLTHRL